MPVSEKLWVTYWLHERYGPPRISAAIGIVCDRTNHRGDCIRWRSRIIENVIPSATRHPTHDERSETEPTAARRWFDSNLQSWSIAWDYEAWARFEPLHRTPIIDATRERTWGRTCWETPWRCHDEGPTTAGAATAAAAGASHASTSSATHSAHASAADASTATRSTRASRREALASSSSQGSASTAAEGEARPEAVDP